MEQAVIWVLGGGLLAIGLVGCIVPVLPGPIIAYSAFWVPFLFGKGLPVSTLWMGAGITAVATVVDYLLPTACAKRFKCSKSGLVGCALGTLAGLFFMPLGLVLGPFAGTVAGELTAGRNLAEAARGGVGAFLGFVSGVFAKLTAVGVMAWMFFSA